MSHSAPRLTVRSAAEMLYLPAHLQERIIHDQKYPKKEPQRFKTPYYQPVINGIRRYYRSGNDLSVLASIRNDLANIHDQARRENNERALASFENSSMVRRRLEPQPNARYSARIGSVELKLSADLQAIERSDLKFMYFNCRNVAVSEQVSNAILEIGYWVLRENGLDVSIDQLEFVDLFDRRITRRSKVRKKTLTTLRDNSRIIEILWNNV